MSTGERKDLEYPLTAEKRPLLKPLTYAQCAKRLGIRNLVNILLFQSKSLRIFLTNFLLTFNIRAGISLLVRLITVIRKEPKSIFSLKALLDEAGLQFREEAVRTGLLVGLFTSSYKAVYFFLAKFNALRFILANKEYFQNQATSQTSNNASDLSEASEDSQSRHLVKKEPWHSAVAGFVAGFSLLVMDKSWHRSLGLYMATRVVQCVYNYNVQNGLFHFWSRSWNHGDSLLFAVSSAQIMYAYVMRPETLPASYQRFIIAQGPYDAPTLELAQRACRGVALEAKEVLNYVFAKSKGNVAIVKSVIPFLFNVNPSMLEVNHAQVDFTSVAEITKHLPPRETVRLLPLKALHAYTTSTGYHTFMAFFRVTKKIFPVYLALSLVPAVVLRFNKFARSPSSVVFKSLFSAVRSTLFLSMFCGGYQCIVNIHRYIVETKFMNQISAAKSVEQISKIVPADNKALYWLAGFLSSGSILLEQKTRRSELALYALPRAVDSVFLILNDRKIVPSIPQGELLLFCASMSGIMFFYENDFDKLSPLVGKLMTRFMNNDLVFRDPEQLEELETKYGMTPSHSSLTLSGSCLAP